MKLTDKDLQFLATLRRLLDDHDLHVEQRDTYLRLRQNYGEAIHSAFRMTRQGVRWRFQRVMDMYISAFQTIVAIERILGADLRDKAIRVSQRRHDQVPAEDGETGPSGRDLNG